MFYSIKNSMKKKLWVIGFASALCLSACGTDKEVEVEAAKIVEAVENKDMKAVEQMIMGTGDFIADEELAGFFTETESENNGIIAKIIAQDSIEMKKVTDEHIVYEISAPELSNIFQDVMKEENITAETFEDYIYNYIETAEKVKIEVEVPYTYENEVFTADYDTSEFMNAITGNLITAYQGLIEQMIQENGGGSAE